MIEVDLAAEDVGERERDRIGQVGGIGRREQRRFDFAGAQREARVVGWRFALRHEAAGAPRDRQKLAVAGEEAQAREPALVVGGHLQRAAGLQLIQRACRGVGAQERHRIGIDHRGAREEAADRVAPLDALLAPVPLIGRLDIGDGGERERARNRAHEGRVDRGVGRYPECSDAGETEDGNGKRLSGRDEVRDRASGGAKRLR